MCNYNLSHPKAGYLHGGALQQVAAGGGRLVEAEDGVLHALGCDCARGNGGHAVVLRRKSRGQACTKKLLAQMCSVTARSTLSGAHSTHM